MNVKKILFFIAFFMNIIAIAVGIYAIVSILGCSSARRQQKEEKLLTKLIIKQTAIVAAEKVAKFNRAADSCRILFIKTSDPKYNTLTNQYTDSARLYDDILALLTKRKN